MAPVPLFGDRDAAGRAVAEALGQYAGRPDVTILGMARGGVAVAGPVARALSAPLEVMVARKLGVPGMEEVAFGAIAEGGRGPVADPVGRFIGLPHAVAARVLQRERAELDRRVRRYRDGRPLPWLGGRTVLVVDDGLSTGATMRAAGEALRLRGPSRLVVAVPVAAASGAKELESVFDEVVALATPEPFGTVSDWYEDFSPVDDRQVLTLLGRSLPHDPGTPCTVSEERMVTIMGMAADLGVPEGLAPKGLVVFAHGGGSSRNSYRNRYLAGRLRLAGWATLRVDLLLPGEMEADAEAGAVRFDIPFITRRLRVATEWCLREQVPGSHRVILLGASTGAAAAIGVAEALRGRIAGVVARGGRVDLATTDIAGLRTPVLMVVGGADQDTLRLNRDSARRLAGPVSLKIVQGAGHTFEEPGALGQVGELVVGWLARRRRMERVRALTHFLTPSRERTVT